MKRDEGSYRRRVVLVVKSASARHRRRQTLYPSVLEGRHPSEREVEGSSDRLVGRRHAAWSKRATLEV